MAASKGKTDLKDLQKRLNDDPKLAQKFLKDPVAALKSEGLTLAPEMAKDLKKFMDASKTTKAKATTDIGEAEKPPKPRPKIKISIKIGMDT